MIECPECGTKYEPITDACKCPCCGEENYPETDPCTGEDIKCPST
jgi:hypothetical protein